MFISEVVREIALAQEIEVIELTMVTVEIEDFLGMLELRPLTSVEQTTIEG